MVGAIRSAKVRIFLPAALALAAVLMLTGVSWAQQAGSVSFGKSQLSGETSLRPTSLEFGPDGRLYAAQQNGVIKAYSIGKGGANQYAVAATENINVVNSIPNHNDDGSLNTSVNTRQVTGILLAGTATNPVIYVSSSDPRIGAGTDGTDTGLDTNSGMISRLTKTSSGWSKVDLVRGLPRSEENHSPNGMQMSPDGQTLYLAMGGNTNQGAPSNNFAFLPETALSAAILEIDLAAIGNSTYDLPTLNDEDRSGANDNNDPFGGNDGKNQARLVPGGPVGIHSPGFRNAYDLVLAESGEMYTIDNGGNAGWGDIPQNAGPEGNCTNAVREPGATNQDNFHHVDSKGYYGGHPNPARGNMSNTFNGTNPQSPVEAANPVECDYDKPASGTPTTFPASTNGMDEYTSSSFDGAMKGDLLAAGFDNKIYRVQLNAAGDAPAEKPQALFSSVGIVPLDLTAQGDGEQFAGTIWAADVASGDITVFEPSDDAANCDASDPNGDADGDGYTNQDERDNGTDPCSSADVPPDSDGDGISDKNDPDDDNDGIPDTEDPFPLDPENGMGSDLPQRIDWDNDSSGGEGGINNTGFTGLMTNGNADYLDLFDPDGMTVGGAGGILTIDEATVGDARSNNQENAFQFGFQFGVDPSTNSRMFTAKTRIAAPFAGLTPENYQSMGFFIGTGDQDNYVKLVTSAKNGQGGIEFAKEAGGQFSNRPQPSVPMPGPDYVDLYLTVDPDAGTVTPSYAVSTGGEEGPRTELGGPEPIPASWLDGTKALAVGVISTSTRASGTFPASWDFIEVVYGDGTATSVAPSELAADPASLDLGRVEAGANASGEVALTNTGTQKDITIGSAAISGADETAFDHDLTGPITLAPGESHPVGVVFSPQSAGPKSAALAVEHDGSNSPLEIPLTGSSVMVGEALYRVNAGGAKLNGTPEWSVDRMISPSPYVNALETGNKVFATSRTIDTTHPSVPEGTPELMFRSERWDPPDGPEMAWAFPVEPGFYEVRLHFAETFTGIDEPAERIFDVLVEGDVSLDNYDIFAEAGGIDKGITETLTVESDDVLNIDFAHIVQNPVIKGIEILPIDEGGVDPPPDPPKTSEASVAIDPPSGGINASTFNSGSFKITNNSPDGQKIESLRLDLRAATLPDMVFDPVGGAGDKTAKCFTPDSGAAATGLVAPADPCVDPFKQPHDDGYDIVEMSFTDFGPGETFAFSADVDPTSIKGTFAPGPNDSGSVSGLELVGSEATIAFDDASVRKTETYRIPNSLKGSKNTGKANLPAKPSIAAVGTQAPATVSQAGQTVRVGGPAGANVSLMVMESGLFTEGMTNGGHDIQPFEANSAIAVDEKTAQIGSNGSVDIPVTLTRSDPAGGLNYMAAVIKDSTGASGPNSDVLVLEFDEEAPPANQPPVLGAIGGQSVKEGAEKTVDITATDPDGDPITLSASGLPGFAGFTDNGGGSGTLTLSPKSGDAGEYQATVAASDGTGSDDEAFGISVAAAQAPGHSLKVSTNADRSNPTSLDGETVSGNIYAFTDTGKGFKRVDFFLDDPDMTGAPALVERTTPHDFAGGSVATAKPFNTANISGGQHTITARIVRSDDTTEKVNATFSVDNSGSPTANTLSASFESVDFEDVEVGETESRRILLTNTGDEDVAIGSAGMVGANAGQFVLRAPYSPPLGPDESKPVEIDFKPTDGGRKSAEIAIEHNGEGGPLKITLSGNGVGGGQAAPRDTFKPQILRPAPRNGAVVRSQRPVIQAIVRDRGSELDRSNIWLLVDGRPVGFSYNPRSDRLVHRSKLLRPGRHVVTVVAVDDSGNRTVSRWAFRVVQPRR